MPAERCSAWQACLYSSSGACIAQNKCGGRSLSADQNRLSQRKLHVGRFPLFRSDTALFSIYSCIHISTKTLYSLSIGRSNFRQRTVKMSAHFAALYRPYYCTGRNSSWREAQLSPVQSLIREHAIACCQKTPFIMREPRHANPRKFHWPRGKCTYT